MHSSIHNLMVVSDSMSASALFGGSLGRSHSMFEGTSVSSAAGTSSLLETTIGLDAAPPSKRVRLSGQEAIVANGHRQHGLEPSMYFDQPSSSQSGLEDTNAFENASMDCSSGVKTLATQMGLPSRRKRLSTIESLVKRLTLNSFCSTLPSRPLP